MSPRNTNPPSSESAGSRSGLQFRTKLSISMAVVVLGVMIGSLLVLRGTVQEEAVKRIKQDLEITRELVSGLIENRRVRLMELAGGAGGSELVRLMLTDTTLDLPTRTDLVENEILPNFPQLDLMLVAGPDGLLLAGNQIAREIEPALTDTSLFQASLEGRAGNGFVFHQGRCLQVMSLPLLIGPAAESELIGAVAVGVFWTGKDLKRLRELSHAEIALLHQGRIFLSTGKPFIALRGEAEPPTDLERLVWTLTGEQAAVEKIGGERFVMLKVVEPGRLTPPFVLAQSLDAQLVFAQVIRERIVQVGLAGIVVGILVSVFLGAGISRPIRRLRDAAGRIAAGDLDQNVSIDTGDEFSELAAAFNRMAAGLKERDRIRNTFGRYIDEEVARDLLQRPEAAALGGDKRTVAILMADLRGFTAGVESLTPEQTLRLLNAFFTRMIEAVKRHRGIIVDFVGDGVLVFFDPLDRPVASAVRLAVDCASDMQREMSFFRQEMTDAGLPMLYLAVGLNAWPVVVGNIGSESRVKYGIVGSPVNHTQRIQEQAKAGEIIASDAVVTQAGDRLVVCRSFQATLKGVDEAFRLHSVNCRPGVRRRGTAPTGPAT